MRMIKLRTGKEVPEPNVKVVMISLNGLMTSNPIALYELVMLCRDKKHQLFGNTGEVLKSYALIEPSGQPHDVIRDVVLAATEGEGLELRLVSPVATDK